MPQDDPVQEESPLPPVEEIPDFPIRINHRKLAEEIAALPGDDDPFWKTLNEHHP